MRKLNPLCLIIFIVIFLLGSNWLKAGNWVYYYYLPHVVDGPEFYNASHGYTHLYIVVIENDTTFEVDCDGDGNFEYQYNHTPAGIIKEFYKTNWPSPSGTISVGGAIRSDKPLQVILQFVHNNFVTYDSGFMVASLLPDSLWGNEYFIPTETTHLFIYSNQSGQIEIIPPNGTSIYKNISAKNNIKITNLNAGTVIRANFPIYLLAVYCQSDENYPWMYTVLPTSLLGTDYYFDCSYGEVDKVFPVPTDSKVWIMSVYDGNIVYIDEDGDDLPEKTYNLDSKGIAVYEKPKRGAHIWSLKKIAVTQVENWTEAPYGKYGGIATEYFPRAFLSSRYVAFDIAQRRYLDNGNPRLFITAFDDNTEVLIDFNWDGIDETKVLKKGEVWLVVWPMGDDNKGIGKTAYIYSNKNIHVTYKTDQAHDDHPGVNIAYTLTPYLPSNRLIWTEDFEPYRAQSWPDNWIKDANANDSSTNYIDDKVSHSGSKSLRLYGKVNSYWAGQAYRKLGVVPPFYIEAWIRNGFETPTSGHTDKGNIGLLQGTSWTNPGRGILYSRLNGDISAIDGSKIGTYVSGEWFKILMKYEVIDNQTQVSYWLNDEYKGTYSVPAKAEEVNFQLDHLAITAQGGTAWYDDIKIYSTIKYSSPIVRLTSPVSGSNVTSKVTIKADAYDEKGIEKVNFYVDGNKLGEDNSEPYSIIWDTTSLTPGSTHTIKAIAFNLDGLSSQDEISVTVYVPEDSPPSIAITSPSNGDTVKGIIQVETDVFDDKGINRVEFFVNGKLNYTDKVYPYTWQWDTQGYNGQVQLLAKVYDTSNQKDEDVISVNVENKGEAPRITRHPESQAVNYGQSVILKVESTGTSPLSFQWYEGSTGDTGKAVSGATSSSFTTPPITSTRSYWVRVRNAYGYADSRTAVITLASASKLEGIVYDAQTRLPLPQASVKLQNNKTVTTNDKGYYLFENLTSGDYSIEISKVGYNTYYGSVSIPLNSSVSRNFYLSPKAGEIKLTSLDSKYTGFVYYLSGVNCNVTYKANIDWANHPPYKVRFLTPVRMYDVSVSGSSASKLFNIKNDFTQNSVLKALAIASDGSKSSEKQASFLVIPPPFNAQFEFVDKGDSFYYNVKPGFSLSFLNEALNEGIIPEDIPFFGNNGFSLSFMPQVKTIVRSSGQVEISLGEEDKPLVEGKLAGFDFSLTPKLNINGEYIKGVGRYDWSGSLKLSGEVHADTTWSWILMLGPVPLPMGWKASFDFSGDAVLGIRKINPVEMEGLFTLQPYIRGMLLAGVNNIAYVGGWIGGGADIDLQYPKTPHLKEFIIYLNAGAEVYIVGWKWEAEALRWDWSLTSNGKVRYNWKDLSRIEPRIYPRDYLWRKDAGRFYRKADFALVKQDRGFISKIYPLQTSIFPHSEPNLSSSSNQVGLVWVTDNESRTDINRYMAVFSTYNGSTWSDPVPIYDDGTADFHPKCLIFDDGSVLATWEDAKIELPDNGIFEDMIENLEISVGYFNPITNTWENVTRLSDNLYVDRSPLLSGVSNNSVMVVWTANTNNDILGGPDNPNTLMYSCFDGNTWSKAQAITEVPYPLIKYDLLYDGNKAFLIASLDTDGDIATIVDRELFKLEYKNGQWGSLVRLTYDNFPDENPHLAFDSLGKVHLVWIRGNKIVEAIDFGMAKIDTIEVRQYSSNLADFKLASSEGKLAIAWVEPSQYSADIYALFYDPIYQAWSSSPIQLTEDSEVESYVEITFLGDGSLLSVYQRNLVEISTKKRKISTKETIALEVPQIINADLYFLKHNMQRDLALKEGSFEVQPDNPEPGGGVILKVEAVNCGEEPAENISIAFYQGDSVSEGILIAESTLEGVFYSGESRVVEAVASIPSNVSSPISIHAVIDPSSNFDVDNRSNNVLTIEIVKPDLTIEESKWESVGTNQVLVSTKVANIGVIDTNTTTVKFKQGGTDGVVLYESVIEPMGKGERKDFQFLWDLSGYSSTDQKLYIIVDEDNAVSEFREDNNDQIITISLLGQGIPTIYVNRSELYFGADKNGKKTSSQYFIIDNTGEGILSWSATPDQSWILVSPLSGLNSGKVEVDVDSSGLQPGTYHGSIMVSDENALNSPQVISITLEVYDSKESVLPFGHFDTPANGAKVYGNVPVTGWALDNIEIEKIEIKRAPHSSDDPIVIGPDGLVFIGEAVFVEEARPDVEQSYPKYPNNYKAGWGYMLLTNFLPNQGNGYFTLYAVAYDIEGNRVILGTKTIYCDNRNSVFPFGTIDTPGQGETISGSSYVNFGWALTPQPNKIPEDGSTIWVWVDGLPLGHPVYNNYREDIATLFPGYANSNGAVGYFRLDTTVYTNGVHNIAWSVEDNAGNVEGIGSRYFNVFNETGSLESSCISSTHGKKNIFSLSRMLSYIHYNELMMIPVNFNPVIVQKGYSFSGSSYLLWPDSDGLIQIDIHETDRIEIRLSKLNKERFEIENSNGIDDFVKKDKIRSERDNRFNTQFENGVYSGFLLVGEELRPLPIGSSLDNIKGIFTWQTGPGFLGEYDLVFVKEDSIGTKKRTMIRVRIKPKF